MQQMKVTVPAGVEPGVQFQMNTPAGPMMVTCPAGVSAGGEMMVNVPLAGPVALATPAGDADVPVSLLF